MSKINKNRQNLSKIIYLANDQESCKKAPYSVSLVKIDKIYRKSYPWQMIRNPARKPPTLLFGYNLLTFSENSQIR